MEVGLRLWILLLAKIEASYAAAFARGWTVS